MKDYTDIYTELRKQAKNDFEKDFYKLIKNSVFKKTMKNVRKHRDIKLATTNQKRNQLVSEPNYNVTKYFSADLLSIEMKKIKVKMNKPVYPRLSILETGRILMYKFWYNYIKPKYKQNAKLCYIDTYNFIINIETEDFYEDISNNAEKRFDISNYEIKRPLPIGMNKKAIGLRLILIYWMMVIMIKKLKEQRSQ